MNIEDHMSNAQLSCRHWVIAAAPLHVRLNYICPGRNLLPNEQRGFSVYSIQPVGPIVSSAVIVDENRLIAVGPCVYSMLILATLGHELGL